MRLALVLLPLLLAGCAVPALLAETPTTEREVYRAERRFTWGDPVLDDPFDVPSEARGLTLHVRAVESATVTKESSLRLRLVDPRGVEHGEASFDGFDGREDGAASSFGSGEGHDMPGTWAVRYVPEGAGAVEVWVVAHVAER